MKRASVAELKAKLSEYLAAARRGEDVIVTDRGQPIARLSGLVGASEWDPHTVELIRTGQLRPPIAKLPRDFWELPRVSDPEGDVLKSLLEEREQGW